MELWTFMEESNSLMGRQDLICEETEEVQFGGGGCWTNMIKAR